MTLTTLIKRNKANGGRWFDSDKMTGDCRKSNLAVRDYNDKTVELYFKDGSRNPSLFDRETGRTVWMDSCGPRTAIRVGDIVDVKHKPDDAFNHDFTGRVILVGKHVRVRDQEDDAWDVDFDQVTITLD